jgi:hypothetical protein
LRFSVLDLVKFWGVKKKTASAAVFWIFVSDSVLLLREPAATPPPSGWNG